MITKLWGWLSLAYMGAIFLISSLPGRELPNLAGKDHYLHLLEFGVLGVLLALWAWGRFGDYHPAWLVALGVVAFVSFYGATDELHQLFVPGRCCDLLDWLADTVGGVVSVLIILPLLRRREG